MSGPPDGTGTTIPDLRIRLLGVAGNIEDVAPIAAAEIREIVELMYRRPPVRQARARQPALSADERDAVRELAAANPELSEWEIGRRFGRNQGRISEALAGYRE